MDAREGWVVVRQARLFTGLVLFTYVATHLINQLCGGGQDVDFIQVGTLLALASCTARADSGRGLSLFPPFLIPKKKWDP